MKIKPVKSISGTIELPGDKSISHRAAILSALAEGASVITNFASSADCASTLECMAALGAEIEREGGKVVVKGAGKNGLREPLRDLDCGNSGTTMRLLSGALAGQAFSSMLVGDASLSGRPMKRVTDPLTQMGAAFETVDGHAPLRITGAAPLNPIAYRLPVASAQIKSAVLLAGLFADGETSVIEPVATRDHTERMLRAFGADVGERLVSGETVHFVSGDSTLTAVDLRVPSDISSAAFFLVAAACLEESEIVMPWVGVNPTRNGVIDVLKRLGVSITTEDQRDSAGEPTATIRVRGGLETVPGAVIRGELVPNVIDEIPILAVLGTQIKGGIEIRDAAELRVKESDRIAAVAENLRKMGAEVEEFADGLRVGRSALRGTSLKSYGDHRIAMAFAVAALFAEGETEIEDAECAAVSFPEFFDVLETVAVR